MAIVIVLTPKLFPRSNPPVTVADSAQVITSAPSPSNAAATGSATPASQPTVGAAPSSTSSAAPAAPAVAARPTVAESLVVSAPRAQTVFVNPGAVPARVTVHGYKSLRPGARDTTLTIAQPRGTLLHYRLAMGADTIALDTVPFTATTSGTTTTFTSASPAMTLAYTTTDGWRSMVRGTVANAPRGATLLIDLPSELRSNEADTLDDHRSMAFGYRIPRRDPESVPFSKLDPGTVRIDTGSFQWVNARDKYWIVALIQPNTVAGTAADAPSTAVFRGLSMRGGTRVNKIAPTAYATTAYPITNGQIAFDLYIGPQTWQELHALGNDLENVNPYASFLHAIVQPFVTIVTRVLLWMKATFKVNYGWVLVIFGITIRLLLWPLNQKAMRSSMAMQRLQPELQEIQRKYKTDPEKQRDALVKLYSAHGMSPFSPMLGCLPMLLPMPVLFALYFVFRNTIEFRGVSFLWLPDISLRDPYYIIPIVMGLSMFVLSWIGMRSMPPNPQAKMMSYMMPVMMTVMFLNFASGLNLYYAVQNIAALPQQWILTRERAKAAATGGAGSATTKRRT